MFTETSTHLIVDVTGWYTDDTAPASTSGRFAAATSITRTLDTGPQALVGWSGPKPTPSTTVTTPSNGAALVGNLTITETEGPGFVQLAQAGALSPGATSNINASAAGETVANAFIAPASGGLAIYTITGTHLILDIAGYITS